MLSFFKQKRVKIFVLDLIFAALLISLLLFVRLQTKEYFEQVQGFSQEIASLEEELAGEASPEEIARATDRLDTIDGILTRSLLLNTLLLPLLLFVFWIVFQGGIWKLSTHVSFTKFTLASIIPMILFFIFVLYFLDYLSYVMFNDTVASLGMLLLILLTLTVSAYFFLVIILKPQLSLKNSLVFAKTCFKKLILPFFLLIIAGGIYVLLLTLIFIFTYVGVSSILPGLLLIVLLVILNYQRSKLVKKFS